MTLLFEALRSLATSLAMALFALVVFGPPLTGLLVLIEVLLPADEEDEP